MTTLLLSGAWNDSTTMGMGMGMSGHMAGKAWRTYPLYIASYYINAICLPLIVLFGLFGNVMTIVIMRRMTTDDSTVNIYFTATAVMDIVCLFSYTVPVWVRGLTDFKIDAIHTVVCKTITWLYTAGGTIGCWYLVCMTVHRSMSVVWPHRVNLLCTRRTVFQMLTVVTVFFALLYSHYLIGLEVRYNTYNTYYICTMDYDDEMYVYFFEQIFLYIELIVYSFLPFIFLAVSNTVLVWKLTASVKSAGSHLTQGDSEQVQARKKAADSVTLTVIVVSIALLAFTLPVSVDFIVNHFTHAYGMSSGSVFAQAWFTTTMCDLLRHANSAVNFYLYCLTGRRFREEFIKVMGRGVN